MPRTEKQLQEIREAKMDLIMETALELFANEGYYNTSISKIAKAAGISKGLMYNYFESKKDLIIAIMKDGMDVIFKSFDPNKDGHLTDEEFEMFVREVFYKIKENIHYWKLYFALFTQPTVHDLVLTIIAPQVEKTISLLSDYYRRKGVENPEMEALLFGSLMDGVGYNYVTNPNWFPLEETIDYIIKRFSYNTKNQGK